ncbi:protein FAM161A-like [Hippocampus zosterae]|uniref:protein FAM161A-like n=1 Tax=Hippocampus zosterae TaxID=109293 RepID=UPI00223D6ADE|nr:protein FAM161A-like [Hippocampus zosterae]
MAMRWRSSSLDEDQCLEYGHQNDDVAPLRRSGGRGLRVRSSLSMHIYGLQRWHDHDDYYHGMEDLKTAHLNNVAQLERMYIHHCDEEEDGHLQRDGHNSAVRKLQKINSQEELDFNETSSGSDQSELSVEDNVSVMTPKKSSERVLSPDDMLMIQKDFRFQPKPSISKQQARVPPRRAFKARPSDSRITVPKPFQMMLRETRKAPTRSEVELENTLLRRELDELRECQKKFRASPAPAHIRRPLADIISRRSPRPSIPGASALQPSRFLERERKKTESKMAAELAGRGGPQEMRRAITAWPRPASRQSSGLPGKSHAPRPPRHLSSKTVKKQLEVSIELVKERDCSH